MLSNLSSRNFPVISVPVAKSPDGSRRSHAPLKVEEQKEEEDEEEGKEGKERDQTGGR